MSKTIAARSNDQPFIDELPQNRLKILHGGTIASLVDLGGSLAVASMGLFATGVSTDLNGTSAKCVPWFSCAHLRIAGS